MFRVLLLGLFFGGHCRCTLTAVTKVTPEETGLELETLGFILGLGWTSSFLNEQAGSVPKLRSLPSQSFTESIAQKQEIITTDPFQKCIEQHRWSPFFGARSTRLDPSPRRMPTQRSLSIRDEPSSRRTLTQSSYPMHAQST